MAAPYADELAGRDRSLEEEFEAPVDSTADKGVARKLPAGWERAETTDNVPYYVSHVDGQTHWDHPHMSELHEKFESFNEIKYAAYKTAMKLRAIQKLTQLSKVKLGVVKNALRQHGLSESHNTTAISVIEMESVLVTMFNNAKISWSQFHPDYCADITLNWLLNCYDSGRKQAGKIKVIQFKLALATLCNDTLEQKYQYYYDQIYSLTRSVNKNTLVQFIKDIMLIPAELGADSSFLAADDEAIAAAANCLQFQTAPSGSEARQVVRKDDFVDWMINEPKFIVWLPTMHRLATSETVKHEAKCGVCKAFPIVGLRFRSLKDFSTDFCQACYFSQKTTKNHKVTHPVREYCLATTTGDDVKDFAKVIRNKVTRGYRYRPRKDGFLNYSSNIPEFETEIDGEPVSQLHTVHDKIQQLAQRLAGDINDNETDVPDMVFTINQLNTKIAALEEENRQFLEEMALLRKMAPTTQEGTEELTAKLEIMHDYTKQLEAEINRLRIVLEQHQQQRPSSSHSLSGSASRDISVIGSEENEIDLLVQQMIQAFPTGHEPGVPVYIYDELYQKTMTISNTAAELVQDVMTCYEPHT